MIKKTLRTDNMKQKKQALYLLVSFLITGMISCSQSEDILIHKPTDKGIPLTVTVTDCGYSNANGTHTRIKEDGYTTTFETGDEIGVFVKRSTDNGTNYTYENVKLTYNGTNWTSDLYYYTSDANKTATYTAYYPYNSGGFADENVFNDYIDNFTPKSNQSTYTDYTASDLMTGTGNISGSGNSRNITFELKHRMALCIIELPITKYILTDVSNNPLPDYYIPASDVKFDGFAPYSIVPGSYRYLVKTNSSTSFNGSYKDGSTTKSYTITPNIAMGGNYKAYKIDNAAVIENNHKLQIGDFYMKDGSLLGKDVTPPNPSDCIGIVYWVGDPTANDPTLKADHKDCNHGLVVAVNGDETLSDGWGEYGINVATWIKNNTNFTSIHGGSIYAFGVNRNKILGYNNTKAIETYNIANSGYKVHAVEKAVTYRTIVIAPESSSDWYLPSVKELSLMCSGKFNSDIVDIPTYPPTYIQNCKLLNNQFNKISGNALQQNFDLYWSSTVYTEDDGYETPHGVDFSDGSVTGNEKFLDYNRVRFTLAF